MTRIQLVDIAKGIAILLVLFGHAIEVFFPSPAMGALTMGIWKFIYSFHVPLFYFLSGVVAPRGSISRVIRSSVRLLILAQLVDLPAVIGSALLLDAQKPATQLLLNGLTFSGQTLIVTWFLASLALVQCISILYDRFGLLPKTGIWSLMMLATILHETMDTNVFQVGSLLAGFLFYRWGLALRRPIEWMEAAKIPLAIPLIISPLVFFIAYGLDAANQGCPLLISEVCPNIAGRFVVFLFNGDMGQIPLFLGAAASGIIATVWMSKSLAANAPGLGSAFSRLGENSLLLLIINGYFLIFFEKNQAVTDYFAGQHALGTACLMVIGMLLIQILASFVLIKPFSWLDRASYHCGNWMAHRILRLS